MAALAACSATVKPRGRRPGPVRRPGRRGSGLVQVDAAGAGGAEPGGLRQIPGIIGCDCRPYLIGVGSRLVYAGSGGATAISADLTGRPVALGATQFFALSAAQSHIWLIRYSHGYEGQGQVTASSVPVTGGPAGPAVTMPARTVSVIAGTDAGFLLQIRLRGNPHVMALWNPGGTPVALPYSPADGITDGFGATARLVAYGSGCQVGETARDAGSTGYDLCKMLRVLNVVTGRLSSFAAPPGTAGWVPEGFNTVSAISPGNGMIAAYAVERPVEKGRTRLYVLQLAGPRRRVTAVPSSAAFLSTSTAWTAAGSWLLYRGPGGHLWAYQATSGAAQASSTPFSGIVAVPSHSGCRLPPAAEPRRAARSPTRVGCRQGRHVLAGHRPPRPRGSGVWPPPWSVLVTVSASVPDQQRPARAACRSIRAATCAWVNRRWRRTFAGRRPLAPASICPLPASSCSPPDPPCARPGCRTTWCPPSRAPFPLSPTAAASVGDYRRGRAG